MRFRLLAVAVVLCAAGCPSPPAQETRYPARKEGCDIKIFAEIPPMPTENIGPVMATCDDSVSDTDCLRTLKDEACKLGADVVWGVDDGPPPRNKAGKKALSGRAAHTKASGAK